MLPTSLALMKPRAYAESRTYSAYQRKNATVMGKMKPRSVLRSRANSSEFWTARYFSLVVELGTSVVNGFTTFERADVPARSGGLSAPYEGVKRVTYRWSAAAPSGRLTAPSGDRVQRCIR